MHICFVAIDYHESQTGGGIASYVGTLGKALVARGHRVTVLAKGSDNETTEDQGLHIMRVKLGNTHWYLYKLRAPSIAVLPVRELEWSLALRRRLDSLLAENHVDVVEGCETGILFLSDEQNELPPLVVRLHGESYVFRKYSGQRIRLGERLNRWLEFAALRRAAAVTSPSRFQAQEVAKDLGWPAERIHVIPNPVSSWLLERALNDVSAVSGRRPVLSHALSGVEGRDKGSAVVLYTGRIEYRKGTVPLLRSVPYVAQEFPDVQYVIAGGQHTSINDRTLNRVLDGDDIRSHVHLLGHVLWQQLADWYRQSTVFVMPSYYETFCISAVEAMAFGLPVVATTAGGLPEVVEDGVTGILVPPGDPQALAEAVVRLLRDPDMRERMGQAGRERVLEKFTVEQVVEEMLKLYHEVVFEHGR